LQVDAVVELVDQHLLEGTSLEHAVDQLAPLVAVGRRELAGQHQ
jgi:hypothetical protein